MIIRVEQLSTLPCCAEIFAAKGNHARYLGDAAIRHYRERTLAELATDLGVPADPMTIHGGIGTLELRCEGNLWTPAPGLAEKAAGLARAGLFAAADALSGRPVLIADADRDARLAVCAACPLWNEAAGTCGKCGCFTRAKASLASATCPDGRWTTPPIANLSF